MEGAGGGGDLPWASIFDSAANLRALSAIQADGFRAASELVERFVRMASSGLEERGLPSPAANRPADDPGDLFGATGLEPMVASWWTMVDQFMRASAPRDERSDEPGRPTLDFSGARASGRLQLETVAPGAAAAEVWLHNGGTIDIGKVQLRCGDLLSHDGTVLPARTLRFEPDLVPMPGRSSRGVTVEVEIDDDLPAGSYRGMLLADGHPDVWLPIEVAVRPLEP